MMEDNKNTKVFGILSFFKGIIRYFSKYPGFLVKFFKNIIKYFNYFFFFINRFVISRLMWQRGKLGRPLGNLGVIIVALMALFVSSFLRTGNVFSDTSLASILVEDNEIESLNEDFLINMAQVATKIPEGRNIDEVKIYKVQAGDTVSQIAQDFNITIDTLLAVNNLSGDDYLYPGQELNILPVSGVTHTVEEGDTLESIAIYYNIDNPQPIIEINWLEKPYVLTVGQKLIVPGGEKPAPVPVQVASYVEPVIVEAPVSGTGQFLWPSPGYVSRGYGWFYGYFHGAIDIANNSCGNPIYAADSGYVEVAGWKAGGWGIGVWINHGNGYYSKYAHLSSTVVSPGTNVSRGQVIGYSGETGLAYGCHLHFVIEKNGVAINPMIVL